MLETINLRIDHINNQHVECTLFCNGINNGTLTFNHEEYAVIYQMIEDGCERLKIKNKSDPAKFINWNTQRGAQLR